MGGGRALKVSFVAYTYLQAPPGAQSPVILWLDLTLSTHSSTSLLFLYARKGRLQGSRMFQQLVNPTIKFTVSVIGEMWNPHQPRHSLQRRTGVFRPSDFGHHFSCSFVYLNCK